MIDSPTMPKPKRPYVFAAELVKAKRVLRGLTQAQVAERCDMSVANYARFEQADTTPRIDVAKRVAVALDCHLDDLVE